MLFYSFKIKIFQQVINKKTSNVSKNDSLRYTCESDTETYNSDKGRQTRKKLKHHQKDMRDEERKQSYNLSQNV